MLIRLTNAKTLKRCAVVISDLVHAEETDVKGAFTSINFVRAGTSGTMNVVEDLDTVCKLWESKGKIKRVATKRKAAPKAKIVSKTTVKGKIVVKKAEQKKKTAPKKAVVKTSSSRKPVVKTAPVKKSK